MLRAILSWVREHVGSPGILILLGSLLGVFGGFWALKQQNRFEDELRAKSEEIADLNRRLDATVTGGDSFCYIDLVPTEILKEAVTGDRALLVLVHQGKYPLYDLAVQVLNVVQAFPKMEEDKFASLQIRRYIENRKFDIFSPEKSLTLGEIIFQGAKQYYVFQFSARNGDWFQNLRIELVGKERKIARKVIKSTKEGGQNLLEKIDPGFPRDEKGRVQW